MLTTPFSEEIASGYTFCPGRIAEIVPGRVSVLSGFKFTEYYFVVSEDRKEMIGIDAGNTDGRQTDYECVRVVNSPSVSHYKYRRKRQGRVTD